MIATIASGNVHMISHPGNPKFPIDIQAVAEAAAKYQVKDKLGYVCTGGGALIRFLTGEELPVVKALRHAAAAL